MPLLDGLEDEVESVLFVAREISCGFQLHVQNEGLSKPQRIGYPQWRQWKDTR